MTIEEAIEILDLETRVSALAEYGYWAGFQAKEAELAAFEEACRVACAALRAQQETKKNDPLTLEDLWEMDGEPVWVQSRDGAKEGIWAFVDVKCEMVRVFTTRYSVKFAGVFRYFKTYGKTWLAYRRRPEEGTP